MSRLTRRDYERIQHTIDILATLGVSESEHNTLRRASMTLQRWGEMECNNDVSREDIPGKVTIRYCSNDGIMSKPIRIPDRETPALKRCQAIADKHGLVFYHQSDPRGAAVYIGKREALGGHDVDAAYTRLICVY